MLPIFVVWTNSTARIEGQIVKLVPCEECHTEYVYLLKREGIGAVTTVYGINLSEAENPASGANETLDQYLKNDFDAVPCPVCGHYQRFMFPKLFSSQSLWQLIAVIGTLGTIAISAFSSIYWLLECASNPTSRSWMSLTVSLALLFVAAVVGLWMKAREGWRAETFNPNEIDDQPSRIELGRKRAKTRAEFEASNCDTRMLEVDPHESNEYH